MPVTPLTLVSPRGARFAIFIACLFMVSLAAATEYDIAVVYPGHDEPIRQNAGNVAIGVKVSPGLETDHTIEIYMDGQIILNGRGSRVELTNVDRGAHTVTAVLRGADGSVISKSDAITFHLLRATKLLGG